MDVSWKRASEICMRNGQRLELVHVGKYNIRTRSFDLNIGDSEISEVLKLREPYAGDPSEAVDGGEGAERGGEFGREANGSNGAVEKLKGLKG